MKKNENKNCKNLFEKSRNFSLGDVEDAIKNYYEKEERNCEAINRKIDI